MPAEWVVTSTTGHANRGAKKEYGYLWWIDPQGKWYAALGRGGQHVFVYPAENLVVVFTAALPYTNDADLIPLQELLDHFILPSVKSDRPLPANPQGLTRLHNGIQALVQSERISPQALPVIATQISEKTFILEENPFGWHTIAFSFQQGADEAKVTIDDQQIAIGLDNLYRIVMGQDGTFPQGNRGHWENENTLVVNGILIGQMVQTLSRVRFSQEAIQINWQEKYSGSSVEIQGILNPVTK